MSALDKIYQLIIRSDTIAVFVHTSPDGDAVGCALAMQTVLRKLGKTVHFFCDGSFDDKLNAIPNAQSVNPEPLTQYALALAVDCSDLNRLGIYSGLFVAAGQKAVIDHHISHVNFGNVDYVEQRSANGEIVFEFLDTYFRQYIDAEVAEALYVAIITDSGAFAYEHVSGNTYGIVEKLYDYGVDFNAVYYKQMREISLGTFKLRRIVLDRADFFCNNKIVFIVYYRKDFEATGTTIHNTSQIISDLINIDCVQIAVSFTEVQDNSFKVSIRTKNPINASDIAANFGGGGHANAAGLRINGFIGNVIDTLLKVCKDNL